MARSSAPAGATASAMCLSISGLVAEHLQVFCAPSPNAGGVMRRQVTPGVFETCQVLLLLDVVEAFDSFQNHHPEVQISLGEFRKLLPWNVQVPAE